MKRFLNTLVVVALTLQAAEAHQQSNEHPDDKLLTANPDYATRTLVVLDTWALLSSHSHFFDNMRADGHVLTFKTASQNPAIKYYDEFFYENILLMAPSATLKENLGQSELIDFVDKGHNMLIFADESSGLTYRRLAN